MNYHNSQQNCLPCFLPCRPCNPLPANDHQPLLQTLPAPPAPQRSRVEYIPFERKVVEMVEEQIEERIPVQRKVTVMQQRVVREKVPVERRVQDFYKVQIKRDFVPKEIKHQSMQKVPVRKVFNVPRYVPVDREIVHLPQSVINQQKRQSTLFQPGLIPNHPQFFNPSIDQVRLRKSQHYAQGYNLPGEKGMPRSSGMSRSFSRPEVIDLREGEASKFKLYELLKNKMV